MNDIPLSEQAPPTIERGEPVGYPLSSETITLVSHMAARMLPGLSGPSTSTLDENQAIALSVRMAVGIANEIRDYRIIDNRAVKPPQKDANG